MGLHKSFHFQETRSLQGWATGQHEALALWNPDRPEEISLSLQAVQECCGETKGVKCTL